MLRTGVRGGFGVRGPGSLPAGYGPAQLRSAYHLPAVGGTGQTVAVVDAGGDPQAAADLAVYRATYHLPPCTTATGCFRQVNQHGKASPLPPDQGWGPEISLDLDMVSAACPSCHILLADANSSFFTSLAAAVDTAARLGAGEVSNSYGADEQKGMQQFEPAYRHPGVAVVAASGDSGYGIPSFPAVFTSVIAAAGTTLARAHTSRGWVIVGGTSVASPFLAGVVALAGHPGLFPTAAHLYTHDAALHDITTGGNVLPGGSNRGGDYQCHAVPGYDGPTGNGTPNGLTGF